MCTSLSAGTGHTETGNNDNFNNLQVWKNDIAAGIEHAILNKTLNETLVALSPLGMIMIITIYFL